jgi:hypothetical protein
LAVAGLWNYFNFINLSCHNTVIMKDQRKRNTFVASFFLLTLLLSLPGVLAQRSVSRDIASGSILPSEQVNVTLNVVIVPGDRFYLIDEIIPDGWIIIDNGGLYEAGQINASESQHLKVAMIQGASSTSYTYRIQAPSTTGTHSFSGTFYIEGMSGSQGIGGENSINVGTQVSNGNNGNTGTSTGNGPSTPTCTNGMIQSTCLCQGLTKSDGYCCDDTYQTVPCEISQGPLPVLAECNESDVRQCGSNIGECSYGTRQCVNGIWGECTGGNTATIELCDGLDNNCDGEIDNDCKTPESASCDEGVIPPEGCFCGDVLYKEGYCYGDVFSSDPVEPFPWIYLSVIGLILLVVLIAEVSYRAQEDKQIPIPDK